MKGITTIELTDVRTGEKEIVKEENMMTNVLNDIFSRNIEGMLYYLNGNTADFHTNMIPICPNSIGGILLFSDSLEEDANSYYAPSANPCVGYASNDVNATADVMRGSLNLTESGKLERGYKFVWDFTTSQGNGTITAVALTHKFGGIGYHGDMYNNSSRVWTVKQVGTYPTGVIRTYYVFAVEVNFEGNYFWSIGMNTSNQIVIRKIRKCFTQVGLNFSLYEEGDEILDEQKVIPNIFLMPNPSNNYSNYTFQDGKDGFWYGFMNDANSSGNCTLKWIKIRKSDFSFSEGTWTLTGVQVYNNGQSCYFDNNPYIYRYSTIMDGYLYLMAYNKKGMYKINLNNAADIKLIEFGFTSNFSGCSTSYQNGCINIWTIGDWVIGSDFRINTNDEVIHTANIANYYYTTTPLFQYGPYLLSFGSYDSRYARKNLWLLTPYLASINNLSTSVIKTADKTMKITYTVTEE